MQTPSNKTIGALNYCYIEGAIIEINQRRNIIKTSISGQDGTVKEFINNGDYDVKIMGYFSTVDANWNSAYPYVVGPTYYGVRNVTRVNAITETTTVYNGSTAIETVLDEIGINMYPNPSADLIILQANEMLEKTLIVELSTINGQIVAKKDFNQGSTIFHLETNTFYNGTYLLSVKDGKTVKTFKVVINH